MRAKERRQGRFVSLSGLCKERGRPGDRYDLKILDSQGRPVSHLMEWFRLRKEPGPDRTRNTYLDLLLPFAGFQIRQGYVWNAEPKQVRIQITEFLREGIACRVSPDRDCEGIFWELTTASPLSESGVRGFLAALKDFYDTMIDAGYYRYPNPLRSQPLSHWKQEWLRSIENAGAPEHAGTRGISHEESREHPTAFFRQKNATLWKPRIPLKEDTQKRLSDALLFMIENTPSQRDKVVVMLLRYTGARPHEILALTAGGYRKAQDPLSAVVVNKRSRGREVKTIHFTSLVEKELLTYIRTERSAADRRKRKRLEDLDDRDPIFLTERGTPYTLGAFRFHWRKLYRRARERYKVTFKLYDIRHLFVTEYIQRAKKEADGDEVKLAELKEGLRLLMAWRSPLTMLAYDHSFSEATGVAQVGKMHSNLDKELARPLSMPVSVEIITQDPPPEEVSTPEQPQLVDGEDEDLLAWVRRH